VASTTASASAKSGVFKVCQSVLLICIFFLFIFAFDGRKEMFLRKDKKKKKKKRRRRTNVFAKISAGKDAHTQIRLHFSDYLYCMIDSEMCFLHEVSN
jgi:hypothetical protein